VLSFQWEFTGRAAVGLKRIFKTNNTFKMKNYIITLLLSILFFSCKTNELYLNVVEPAPVTIPGHIKNVGVINRSLPTKETKVLDVVDKVLTVEGANLDKDGSDASIKGLVDELSANNRFTSVEALKIDFRTPKNGLFPVPLSWEIVDRICKETGKDALFALEIYDTDTKINYSNKPVEIKTLVGTLPALEHHADMETIVKQGWRIYDPAGRAILDEYNLGESVVYSGKGVNPMVAAAGLIGRKDAVKEVSNKAGHEYAMRILPFELRVMRDYYVKGTNNFKIAKRRAQVGKWNEAGELWEKETDNPRLKVAGRACYNMAIINEINGDLDQALQWAQKAYEDYNIKLALRYTRILENRKYKTEVLVTQEK
jgi:hypothetical protein